jgi:hypothetical protein
MIGTKHLRLTSAQPRVAQPHRWMSGGFMKGGYFYASKQTGATRSGRCTCVAASCWLCQHRARRAWGGHHSNHSRRWGCS